MLAPWATRDNNCSHQSSVIRHQSCGCGLRPLDRERLASLAGAGAWRPAFRRHDPPEASLRFRRESYTHAARLYLEVALREPGDQDAWTLVGLAVEAACARSRGESCRHQVEEWLRITERPEVPRLPVVFCRLPSDEEAWRVIKGPAAAYLDPDGRPR